MAATSVPTYQQNQKRPWSEFRPVMFGLIMLLHILALAAVGWHVIVGFWPSTTVIVTALVLYVFTGLSIALGYHRLFTHQGYECKPWLKRVLLTGCGLSLQGSAITWIRTHICHHTYSDRPGDAHSPLQYQGSAWLNLKGIMWAHMGWLFYRYTLPNVHSKSVEGDPQLQWQTRNYHYFIIASFAIPAFAGGVAGWLSGGWQGLFVGALDGALVAGVLRIVVFLHITWCINSICHLVGELAAVEVITRNIAGEIVNKEKFPSDGSRNAHWLLKWLSFGEANHAMHHLFQRVAYHAWGKWGIDPAKWTLMLLERTGVVWDVQKPPEHNRIAVDKLSLPDTSFVSKDKLLGQEKDLVAAT